MKKEIILQHESFIFFCYFFIINIVFIAFLFKWTNSGTHLVINVIGGNVANWNPKDKIVNCDNKWTSYWPKKKCSMTTCRMKDFTQLNSKFPLSRQHIDTRTILLQIPLPYNILLFDIHLSTLKLQLSSSLRTLVDIFWGTMEAKTDISIILELLTCFMWISNEPT